MAKKHGSRLWLTVAIGLAVVGLVVFRSSYMPSGWLTKSASTELKGARVKRGPLSISVLQHGNLAAKDAVSIKSELEGQTTILFLIPEGQQVKPGDLLCELDASDLVEKKLAQEINLQNAEAAFTKAKAQYDIQDSQNKSDIEAAERKLRFAQIDLDKYVKGDYAQQVKQADDKILLAQQKRTQAKTTFEFSQELAQNGFITKTELDRDDLDFQSADVQLDQAVVAKDLFKTYDDPRKRTELEANLREAERGLERAQLRAQSLIVDYEAGLKSSEAKLKLEREKFTKYEDQVRKARIVSDTTGMVVYSRQDGRGYGGDPIQEGTQVRERQEILQIPRTGGLIVEASVHESVLKQVAVGMSCRISIDALPGHEFEGTVQYVALLPDKGSWWANPNQRLYKTEVLLRPSSDASAAEQAAYADMRPGMSCSIEILADEIDSCLYVPVQCVVYHRGGTIAFVPTPTGVEERPVKVGRANDKFVEVLEGLAENEEVLLAPPAGFMPAEEERTDAKAKNADHAKRATEVAGAAARVEASAAKSGASAMHADAVAAPASDGATGVVAMRPDAAAKGSDDAVTDGGTPRGERSFDPSKMPEEMRKRFEAMSPEERTKMMERFKSGGGRDGKRRGERQDDGGPAKAAVAKEPAAVQDSATTKDAGAIQHDDTGTPK